MESLSASVMNPALAICEMTKFLRVRDFSGFSTGLYLVGLLTIPTRVALSSTVRSMGFFAKKVWEADLMP